MNSTQWLSIGALVTFLTIFVSCLKYVKAAFLSMQKVWLETVQLDTFLSAAVYRKCVANMKASRFRSKVYNGCIGTKEGEQDESAFVFDIMHQSTIVFWKGLRFIVLCPGPWKYDEVTNNYERTVNAYIPRIFWNPENFIRDAVNNFNITKIKEKRFGIRRFHGKLNTINISLDETKKPESMLVGVRALMREVQLGRATVLGHKSGSIVFDGMGGQSPFEWYAFNSNVMPSVNRIRAWYKKKHWYKAKHIPWRRGINATGMAGSGKTLLMKCLAEDLDIPIFCFDIASMVNEELVKFWGEAASAAPCMILLEDFDSVFQGRVNVVKRENTVSFDCLLNCISGVESSNGILLGITTNHPEHLDEALIRPGRIDEHLAMNEMEDQCRETMASRILELDGAELAKIVEETRGMTAAKFTEFCNNIILSKLHSTGCVNGVS